MAMRRNRPSIPGENKLLFNLINQSMVFGNQDYFVNCHLNSFWRKNGRTKIV